ncbi:MAG: hypothetical protein AAF352_06540 [Pseudomonadota bacterium]
MTNIDTPFDSPYHFGIANGTAQNSARIPDLVLDDGFQNAKDFWDTITKIYGKPDGLILQRISFTNVRPHEDTGLRESAQQ